MAAKVSTILHAVLIFLLINIHGKGNIYHHLLYQNRIKHHRGVIKYIRKVGFPVQVYNNLETPDGYILTMFRINISGHKYKGAVLFMHGLTASGEYWFINKPNKTLPFQLARDGYDIWIGNFRGCSHSLKHIRWDSNSPLSPYWNYSFHELGVFDLPTMIDFTLNKTKCKQLIYIGHSQATATFFIMASVLPDYNNKIKLMIALAPVVFTEHIDYPIYKLISKLLGKVSTVMFTSLFNNSILKEMCSLKGLQELCTYGFFIFTGFGSKETDKTLLPTVFKQMPDSISTKQLLHLFQAIRSGYFRQYDYKPLLNKKYYGTVEPPSYNLSKISCHVLLYYASNDIFSTVKDVEKLNRVLPNSKMHYVNSSTFTHNDYILAKHINRLVYDSTMEEITYVKRYC